MRLGNRLCGHYHDDIYLITRNTMSRMGRLAWVACMSRIVGDRALYDLLRSGIKARTDSAIGASVSSTRSRVDRSGMLLSEGGVSTLDLTLSSGRLVCRGSGG